MGLGIEDRLSIVPSGRVLTCGVDGKVWGEDDDMEGEGVGFGFGCR